VIAAGGERSLPELVAYWSVAVAGFLGVAVYLYARSRK
jgi:hypothetical protein